MIDFWKLMQDGRIFIYKTLLADWTILRIVTFGITMFRQVQNEYYARRGQDKRNCCKNKQYFSIVLFHSVITITHIK